MNEVSYFAITNYRNQAKRFGIKQPDRRQHLYCVGKTGAGKSTLLQNLIIQDLRAGRGLALIDPHGDLSEALLDYVPKHRTEHVAYLNPADLDYPLGLNILEDVPADQRHLVASSVVASFKSLWSDSWGPRLEYLLHHAAAALVACPNTTLLGIPRLLSDDRYRERVLRYVDDPVVHAFWEREYASYSERFKQEAIAPVLNKVGQFLASAPLRNILGQVKSSVDARFMMDNERILIANLAKGQLGEDKANLLGSLLVTKFQLAAMARSTTPEHERIDFHLYIDEFHNFTTRSFAAILSEARKYRLNLTLSHQYLEQLSEPLQQAVFGNVGSLITFRVGARDAELLAREFDPTFAPHHLTSLPRFEIYLRLMIDGVCSRPFSASTLEPDTQVVGRKEVIMGRSRERFGRRRAVVEAKIHRWLAA